MERWSTVEQLWAKCLPETMERARRALLSPKELGEEVGARAVSDSAQALQELKERGWTPGGRGRKHLRDMRPQ